MRLPTRSARETDAASLTFASFEIERPAPAPAVTSDPKRESVAQAIVTPTNSLSGLHPVTKRTALRLKCDWRRELIWCRGERTGPVLDIQVQHGSTERALMIADCLIRSADSLSWKFVATECSEQRSAASRADMRADGSQASRHGAFLVEEELISIRIDERSRRIPHVIAEAENRTRKDRLLMWYSRCPAAPPRACGACSPRATRSTRAVTSIR